MIQEIGADSFILRSRLQAMTTVSSNIVKVVRNKEKVIWLTLGLMKEYLSCLKWFIAPLYILTHSGLLLGNYLGKWSVPAALGSALLIGWFLRLLVTLRYEKKVEAIWGAK